MIYWRLRSLLDIIAGDPVTVSTFTISLGSSFLFATRLFSMSKNISFQSYISAKVALAGREPTRRVPCWTRWRRDWVETSALPKRTTNLKDSLVQSQDGVFYTRNCSCRRFELINNGISGRVAVPFFLGPKFPSGIPGASAAGVASLAMNSMNS